MEVPSHNAPLVSVIIPILRDWDSLPGCLDALSGQSYDTQRMEIFIVNNGPESAVPPWMRQRNDLNLRHDKEPSSYAARNTGIKASQGEILAFTDADCVPRSDWIEQAVEIFRADPRIARIGGGIELFYRDPRHLNAVELFESVFAFQQQKKVELEKSALTANMFARRTVFDSVGLFNETLKSGGDSEWGTRAAKGGFPIVYAPQASISHPARHRLGQLGRKTIRLYGGKWQRTLNKAGGTATFVEKFRVFRPGLSNLRIALKTPKLSYQNQRLKVIGVLSFVGLVQLYEHVRLLLGSRPRQG